jgi:tetratricopeptide (TPR) repeat protein
MNKLLDKHIKLYPKDWRAYEKKIDCLRELKKYPDMHKAFDDYFIQNREDYFVFYIKMKLVDYKTPSEAINACMIFIQHRAEYLMQTHQLVDVAEFVVLCKNIAGWMVDKLCPTWYEYTRKSYKEFYKEFLEKRNDYLADLYYQLVNILKSASLMDASLIDAYVDIYKEVLVLKPDHKEAKQALENILKFKDTLKAIEIKEINDFVIVACIDHNDNYLNSQQAKDDLAIVGRLDDVLKIYHDTLQSNPTSAKDCYYRMAMVYQVQGQLAKATEAYQETIKLKILPTRKPIIIWQ